MLMSPLMVHSHPPARRVSAATRQTLFTGFDVCCPITTTGTVMEEHWQSILWNDATINPVPKPDWQSFYLHDTAIDPVPEPDWGSFVMVDDNDYNAFKSLPENPRVKCLRFEKLPGTTPPYCATAPAFFPKLRLDRENPKPSPLQHVALSNVPLNSLERSDSRYDWNKEEKPRKKHVSFCEMIQILEIEPDTAVEAQAWARYPEVAMCKDWDGRYAGYERRRQLMRKLKQWGLYW